MSSQYFGNSSGSNQNNLSRTPTSKKIDASSSSLVSTSLDTMSAVFVSCGSILPPAFHKNVQCSVISLCLELQRYSDYDIGSPFKQDCKCRVSLYRLLLRLLCNPHPRWPVPFRYAYQIFRVGHVNETYPSVRGICQEGMSVITGVKRLILLAFLHEAHITYQLIFLLCL